MEEDKMPEENKTTRLNKLKSIWRWIRSHKLAFLLLLFAFHMFFIDSNNIIKKMKYQSEINELKSEIDRYKREYEESTKQLNELQSDPKKVSRIAREKYFMKQPNEDIYIFEE